jgi:hypothetical protein
VCAAQESHLGSVSLKKNPILQSVYDLRMISMTIKAECYYSRQKTIDTDASVGMYVYCALEMDGFISGTYMPTRD